MGFAISVLLAAPQQSCSGHLGIWAASGYCATTRRVNRLLAHHSHLRARTGTMDNPELDSQSLIPLIYEAAEDLDLWPKLLSACKRELLESGYENLVEHDDLLAHLQRALRMNHRMDEVSKGVDSAQNLLNFLPVAIITITEKLEILSKNLLAERLLAASDIFNIQANRLRTDKTQVMQELRRIVKAAINDQDDSDKRCAMKVEAHSGSMSIFALGASRHKEENEKLCTIFIASSTLSEHLSASSLKNFYKLTQAESRLALMLASGHALADISQQLNVSQNTVRNQLKSVFAKTGTGRQAELVALILATPTQLPEAAESQNTEALHPADTPSVQSLVLRDGRCLRFFETGDPGGVPILYHHDILSMDWWNLIEDNILYRHGIRLIHPYRPGFNGTDLHDQHDLRMWSQDAGELLDHLDIDRFYSLGNSSGSLFAMASAFFMADRCEKLSIINAMSPIESLRDLDGIKPAMSHLLLSFARLTPGLYRKFFNSLLRTISRNSKNYLQTYISHWSPADSEFVKSERILRSLDKGLHNALQNSRQGLVYECLFAARADWGFELKNISTPTEIWRGKDDKGVPKAISYKLKSIPNHIFMEMPDSGHLLILAHASTILESLLEQNRQQENTIS